MRVFGMRLPNLESRTQRICVQRNYTEYMRRSRIHAQQQVVWNLRCVTIVSALLRRNARAWHHVRYATNDPK